MVFFQESTNANLNDYKMAQDIDSFYAIEQELLKRLSEKTGTKNKSLMVVNGSKIIHQRMLFKPQIQEISHVLKVDRSFGDRK